VIIETYFRIIVVVTLHYIITNNYQAQIAVKLQTVSMCIALIDWFIVESRESKSWYLFWHTCTV